MMLNLKNIDSFTILYASQIYGITASQSDKYAKKIFTDNFQALTLSIKAAVLDYWAKLDKADN
jgi:hypothetical protein